MADKLWITPAGVQGKLTALGHQGRDGEIWHPTSFGRPFAKRVRGGRIYWSEKVFRVLRSG